MPASRECWLTFRVPGGAARAGMLASPFDHSAPFERLEQKLSEVVQIGWRWGSLSGSEEADYDQKHTC